MSWLVLDDAFMSVFFRYLGVVLIVVFCCLLPIAGVRRDRGGVYIFVAGLIVGAAFLILGFYLEAQVAVSS